jgi:small subunit ribosomal protein S20
LRGAALGAGDRRGSWAAARRTPRLGWLDPGCRYRENTRLFLADPFAHRHTGRRTQEIDFVANSKSAEKRARQAVTRRAHNMAARSRLRTSIKKVLLAVGAGDKDLAVAAYKEAQPLIDTMVTKGIIHRNKAARHKSDLNAKVKALAAK